MSVFGCCEAFSQMFSGTYVALDGHLDTKSGQDVAWKANVKRAGGVEFNMK